MSEATPTLPSANISASSGTRDHLIYVLRSNPVTLLAFLMFAVLILCAVIGPYLVPYDPLQTNAANALKPPSWDHWFGTDNVSSARYWGLLPDTGADGWIQC